MELDLLKLGVGLELYLVGLRVKERGEEGVRRELGLRKKSMSWRMRVMVLVGRKRGWVALRRGWED